MDSTEELLKRGRKAVESMGYLELMGEDLESILTHSPSLEISQRLVDNLELASRTPSLLTRDFSKYSVYPGEGESSIILLFLAYDSAQANSEVGIAEMWAKGKDLYEQANKIKR